MQELVLRKQRLEKKIARYELFDELFLLLCLVSGLMISYTFFEPILIFQGIALVGYLLGICLILSIFGLLEFSPFESKKEIQEIDKQLSSYTSIHQKLDSLRDEMLFDDDPTYWSFLEDLAEVQ